MPLPETASSWIQGCQDLPAGSICSANCLYNATGSGYDATCGEGGTWSVTGLCECELHMARLCVYGVMERCA